MLVELGVDINIKNKDCPAVSLVAGDRSLSNNDIVPGFDDETNDGLRIRLKKVNEVPGCLALYLSGYIDVYNSICFQKKVYKAIEAGYTKLIFHVGEYTTVSSVDLGCFVAFLKMIKPVGGDLVFIGVPPKVNEVFQVLGFSQFFNFRDSLDEAIQFFKQANC